MCQSCLDKMTDEEKDEAVNHLTSQTSLILDSLIMGAKKMLGKDGSTREKVVEANTVASLKGIHMQKTLEAFLKTAPSTNAYGDPDWLIEICATMSEAIVRLAEVDKDLGKAEDKLSTEKEEVSN